MLPLFSGNLVKRLFRVYAGTGYDNRNQFSGQQFPERVPKFPVQIGMKIPLNAGIQLFLRERRLQVNRQRQRMCNPADVRTGAQDGGPGDPKRRKLQFSKVLINRSLYAGFRDLNSNISQIQPV